MNRYFRTYEANNPILSLRNRSQLDTHRAVRMRIPIDLLKAFRVGTTDRILIRGV